MVVLRKILAAPLLGFNFVLIGIYKLKRCTNTHTMSNCPRLSRVTLVRQVSGRIGKSPPADTWRAFRSKLRAAEGFSVMMRVFNSHYTFVHRMKEASFRCPLVIS